jgi:hypothetical protein
MKKIVFTLAILLMGCLPDRPEGYQEGDMHRCLNRPDGVPTTMYHGGPVTWDCRKHECWQRGTLRWSLDSLGRVDLFYCSEKKR